jgi:hypothetical protein
LWRFSLRGTSLISLTTGGHGTWCSVLATSRAEEGDSAKPLDLDSMAEIRTHPYIPLCHFNRGRRSHLRRSPFYEPHDPVDRQAMDPLYGPVDLFHAFSFTKNYFILKIPRSCIFAEKPM